MKDTNKLIKNVLRALPVIPLFAPKKTSLAPFILGAIGVAVAGGIAAVMIFSPRTRYRMLDIAKDGYGKVRGQIDQLGVGQVGMSQEGQAVPQGYANGLGSETAGSYASGGGV